MVDEERYGRTMVKEMEKGRDRGNSFFHPWKKMDVAYLLRLGQQIGISLVYFEEAIT